MDAFTISAGIGADGAGGVQYVGCINTHAVRTNLGLVADARTFHTCDVSLN